MNLKKTLLVIALIVVVLGGIFFGVYYKFFRGSGDDFIDLGSSLSAIPLKQGSDFSLQISVENNLDFERNFEVYFEGLEDLATVDKEKFTLGAGEKQFLVITFEDLEGVDRSVYTGKMVVWSEESTRESAIVVDYESSEVLFDSSIELYPVGGVAPGETLTADITINDFELIGKSELEMNYFIKDFSDNEILSESEIISVDGRTPISRSFVIPMNIREGDYVFGVVLKYGDSVGTSSSFFRVGKTEQTKFFSENKIYLIIIFILFLFLFAIFIFYSVYSREKMFDEWKKEALAELRRKDRGVRVVRVKQKKKKPVKAKHKKLSRKEASKRAERRKQISEIKEKLNDKLLALQSARESGFIEKESFEKGSERIRRLLHKI